MDEIDVELHRNCPINSLLKNIPAINEVVQLYYRCKLCDQTPVHIDIDRFLQHLREFHSPYFAEDVDMHQVSSKQDVGTVVVSSDQAASTKISRPFKKQKLSNIASTNIVESSWKLSQKQTSHGHTSHMIQPPYVDENNTPSDRNIVYDLSHQQKTSYQENRSGSSIEHTTEVPMIAHIGQVHQQQLEPDQQTYILGLSPNETMSSKPAVPISIYNQITNQLSEKNFQQSDFSIPVFTKKDILQTNYHNGDKTSSAGHEQDETTEASNVVEAILHSDAHYHHDSSLVTPQVTHYQHDSSLATPQVTRGSSVTVPKVHCASRVLYQTRDGHSLMQQQVLLDDVQITNPSQVVATTSGTSLVEKSENIISNPGEGVPVNISIESVDIMSSIANQLQQPNTFNKSAAQEVSLHIEEIPCGKVEHITICTTKNESGEYTYVVGEKEANNMQNVEYQEHMEETVEESLYQEEPNVGNSATTVTSGRRPDKQNLVISNRGKSAFSTASHSTEATPVDDIPRRGRPSIQVKPSEDAATKYQKMYGVPFSLVTSPSYGTIHKGPLHHKDRIQETMTKCNSTDQPECQYVVFGTHYHCKACRGIIREEDMIAHKYSHSSTRLITEVNIQQVVLNGQFCEDIECTANQKCSVIHMHCGHCDEKLETGHRFHEHLKSQHPEIWKMCQIFQESDTDIEQCLMCRAYYGTQEYLTKHMTDRHFAKYSRNEMQSSVLICCEEEFPQIEPFKIHMAVQHKTLDPVLFKPQSLSLRCLDCGEEAVGKQLMKKHQWLMHRSNDNNLKNCIVCASTFADTKQLKAHMDEKHKGADKRVSCTDCIKTFSTEDLFRKHFAIVHSKKYSYTCDDCGRGFHGAFQYLKHLETKHPTHSSKYTQTCNGCKKTFCLEQSLRKHEKVCLKFTCKALEKE